MRTMQLCGPVTILIFPRSRNGHKIVKTLSTLYIIILKNKEKIY